MASISVARLLQLRVPIAWQEAVEVTRLAGIAAERDLTALSLAGCLLGDDGSVVVTNPTGPHLTAMQLLGAMLDGQSAPPELATLVMVGDEAPSGFSTPSQERPKGLSLEWFVRPNPEVEVARLAARGLAAEDAQFRAKSLSDLRAQVAEQPPAEKPPVAAKKPMPPWVEYAALGAAATLVLGGMWLAWTAWGSGVATTVTFADVASAVKTAASAAVERVAPSAPPAAPVATPPPAAAPAPSRARRSNVGVTRSAAPAALARSVPSSPAMRPEEADGRKPYVTEEVVVYPVESRVYSQEDAAVAPPALVYPKLPSQPKADSRPTDSFMEVVVDERGEVLRVRLRSTDATLNDRMLVSAVKAWRFDPAVKDGVPVKYTLRVPVLQ
jgi:hypothetical protein